MSNKKIIEFGFRIISWGIKLHVCVIYLSIWLQQITQTSLLMIRDIILNFNQYIFNICCSKSIEENKRNIIQSTFALIIIIIIIIIIMTLLDYTITGRTSSSHCGPLIKTERGDRQLQWGHWLRYSAEVIFNFWRKRKHLSSTHSHRNPSSRKSIASRCRTIFIYKIFRHYRLDFLVKQTSFQDNFC